MVSWPWHWPWIGSRGITLCSSYGTLVLPTHQISYQSHRENKKKLSVNGWTDVCTDTRSASLGQLSRGVDLKRVSLSKYFTGWTLSWNSTINNNNEGKSRLKCEQMHSILTYRIVQHHRSSHNWSTIPSITTNFSQQRKCCLSKNNCLPIFSVISHDGMKIMLVLVLLYRGEYDSRMFCGFKSRCTIPFVLSALSAAASNKHAHTQRNRCMHVQLYTMPSYIN